MNTLELMCKAHHEERTHQGFTISSWDELRERNKEEYRKAMRAALDAALDADEDLKDCSNGVLFGVLSFWRKRASILSEKRAMLLHELEVARDALHNDFEPDNQSVAWHRLNNLLKKERS